MNPERITNTRLTLLSAAILTLTVSLVAQAGQHQLRYEWAATPEGPFTPVPREQIKVHADGTATVADSASRGFFRLLFDYGGGGGGGASVPIRPLDSVPPTTLAMLSKFVIAIVEDDSVEGKEWTGATIAPFVTPITSAWNESGEPDLVELKIVGPCETARSGLFANNEGPRRSSDRGFIVVSLNRKSPPVVGYATDGLTPCESLLANCQGMRVHCIRRFGPMFLAAEDADGNLLGNEGLFPALYPDSAYEDHSRPLNYFWDSENRDNPPLPEAPPRAVPETFSSYPQLREACRSSPWLTKRRRQREALIEFDWLAMEGKAPTLKVDVGKELTFLADETFTSFSLDDEEGRGAVVTVARAEPGVKISGLIEGAHRLTLYPESGATGRRPQK
jgi:hypothetical protein